MMPRERVLQAIDRQPTDRAPADYSANQSVTEALIAKLGVADVEELYQALGVDMRRVGINYRQPDSEPDADGYIRTMWGERRRPEPRDDGLPDWVSPFTEDTTVDDVHGHDWPDAAALDYSHVRADCERHRGNYATYGGPWSPFFHEVGWMIGQERFYIWMSTKPEVTAAIVSHVVDYEIEVARRFLEAADGLLDITYFGNDLGTQRGLFIGPAMFERFLRPQLQRYFAISHDFGCRVMKHSCGAVRDLLPSFIADGVDILDPVQVRAAGMDMPGLVRDFGDHLCFHGGVDTQHTLPFGSTADVRAQVRSYLELMRGRGGYILTGSQSFIEDIPLDNILAAYDENRKATT